MVISCLANIVQGGGVVLPRVGVSKNSAQTLTCPVQPIAGAETAS